MTRLGKNGKAKPDRFRKAWNPGSIRIPSARSGRRSSSGRKKLSRGASLRGQGTPADPARLRSERARNSSKTLYIAGRENLGSFWPADLPSFADFRIAVRQEVAASLPENLLYFSSSPAGIRTARWRQPR